MESGAIVLGVLAILLYLSSLGDDRPYKPHYR